MHCAVRELHDFHLHVVLYISQIAAPMVVKRKHVGLRVKGKARLWGGRCALWRAALNLNWCEVPENEDHDMRQKRGWVSVRRQEWRVRQENWFVWGMGWAGEGRRRRGDRMGEGWGEGENDAAGINWKWLSAVLWVVLAPQSRVILFRVHCQCPSVRVETLCCEMNTSHQKKKRQTFKWSYLATCATVVNTPQALKVLGVCLRAVLKVYPKKLWLRETHRNNRRAFKSL